MKSTHVHGHGNLRMYMANARNLMHKKLASPNARDTNMLVFFALGNAKVLSFVLGDAKLPNANGFASQWNIGLSQFCWVPQANPVFGGIWALRVICRKYYGMKAIGRGRNI